MGPVQDVAVGPVQIRASFSGGSDRARSGARRRARPLPRRPLRAGGCVTRRLVERQCSRARTPRSTSVPSSESANSRSRQASPGPECLQEGCKHSVLSLAMSGLGPTGGRPRSPKLGRPPSCPDSTGCICSAGSAAPAVRPWLAARECGPRAMEMSAQVLVAIRAGLLTKGSFAFDGRGTAVGAALATRSALVTTASTASPRTRGARQAPPETERGKTCLFVKSRDHG